MGRYNGKACRLISMMSMTLAFFVVELTVGHMANSLALIADSFHMLSDVVALVVGFLSIKFAKRGSSHNKTYGWARAEVVGALVNAVFLVALCFTILVEALERLITREPIDDAYLLLYVGGAGLLINIIGLGLFHNQAHGHTHGGMSHSHGAGGHGHSHSHQDNISGATAKLVMESDEAADDKLAEESSMSITLDIEEQSKNSKKSVGSQQLNMRGVFLHVLGDALGSVVVMVSAGATILVRELLDHCHESRSKRFVSLENHTDTHTHNDTVTVHTPCIYRDPEWLQCVDPILSLILVVIILCTSVPLLKQTGNILMQTVPAHITVTDMQDDILQMEGVLGVHEFHVWSLAGNRVIASLHVIISRLQDYVNISNRVKHYFHTKGIHSITIQPEFVEVAVLAYTTGIQEQVWYTKGLVMRHHECKDGRECALECGPDMDCHGDTCCVRNTDSKSSGAGKTSSSSTDVKL